MCNVIEPQSPQPTRPIDPPQPIIDDESINQLGDDQAIHLLFSDLREPHEQKHFSLRGTDATPTHAEGVVDLSPTPGRPIVLVSPLADE